MHSNVESIVLKLNLVKCVFDPNKRYRRFCFDAPVAGNCIHCALPTVFKNDSAASLDGKHCPNASSSNDCLLTDVEKSSNDSFASLSWSIFRKTMSTSSRTPSSGSSSCGCFTKQFLENKYSIRRNKRMLRAPPSTSVPEWTRGHETSIGGKGYSFPCLQPITFFYLYF